MRHSFLLAAVLAAGCTGQQSVSSTSPPASATRAAPSKIGEFQGEYRYLSNFWPAQVEFEEITYPSVEHAYQAAKTLDTAERRRIAALATPEEAKRAGRALTYRSDWERAKFDVMERCVRDKFTRHPDLAAKLLATGDAYLEEGNTWNDQIWGVYQGKGENRLGKTLMKVREELRYRSHGPCSPAMSAGLAGPRLAHSASGSGALPPGSQSKRGTTGHRNRSSLVRWVRRRRHHGGGRRGRRPGSP